MRTDCSAHRCHHPLGLEDHLPIVQPNHQVAERRQREVAIVIPGGGLVSVEGCPVGLDDDPPGDNEVDSAHTVEIHLHLIGKVQSLQLETKKGLEDRLTSWIDQVSKTLKSVGEMKEDDVELRRADEPESHRAIK